MPPAPHSYRPEDAAAGSATIPKHSGKPAYRCERRQVAGAVPNVYLSRRGKKRPRNRLVFFAGYVPHFQLRPEVTIEHAVLETRSLPLYRPRWTPVPLANISSRGDPDN